MPQFRADSETAAANLALGLLFMAPISSLDQPNSKSARQIKQWFAVIRDRLQREYRWNFNISRIPLAEAPQAPVGFAHAYHLPGDCLRVLELIDRPREDWQAEDGLLLSDLGPPLNVRFLRRETSPGKWDPAFTELFAHELAAAAGPGLARDRRRVADLSDRADDLRRRATPVDAREGRERIIAYESSFVTARRPGCR